MRIMTSIVLCVSWLALYNAYHDKPCSMCIMTSIVLCVSWQALFYAYHDKHCSMRIKTSIVLCISCQTLFHAYHDWHCSMRIMTGIVLCVSWLALGWKTKRNFCKFGQAVSQRVSGWVCVNSFIGSLYNELSDIYQWLRKKMKCRILDYRPLLK